MHEELSWPSDSSVSRSACLASATVLVLAERRTVGRCLAVRPYLGGWSDVRPLCLRVDIDDDLATGAIPSARARRRSPAAAGRSALIALAHVVVGALDVGRWHLAPGARPAPCRRAAGDGRVCPARRPGDAREPLLLAGGARADGTRPPGRRPRALRRRSVIPAIVGMIVSVIPCSGLVLGSWLGVRARGRATRR